MAPKVDIYNNEWVEMVFEGKKPGLWSIYSPQNQLKTTPESVHYCQYIICICNQCTSFDEVHYSKEEGFRLNCT